MITGELVDDCKVIETELKKIKLHTSNNRKDLNAGKAPISCVYGLVPWSKYSNGKLRIPSDEFEGWYHSKLRTDYPYLQTIFEDFANHHLPKDFEWSQVVINKNFKSLKHIDAKNVGMSYIVGLGDYSGGELAVIRDNKETLVNIKYKPYGFNGSIYSHYTMEFQGDRYSIVFYKNNKHKKRKDA